jgi:methyl coenzyme M reductase subunit D
MNNDISTLTIEDAIKYLTVVIPKSFPHIYLMPTTANKIKSKINSLKNIHVGMMK